MGTPDLTHARRLFHHRDAALDQPYGEGVELALFQLQDGRLYRTQYRYHIDFDGSNDDRFVSREVAIEDLAAHGGSAQAAALFPDAPEARWFARFGTCNRYALDLERVAAEATTVWRVDGPAGQPPAFLAADAGDGLWVLDRPGSDGRRWRSLERPGGALEALLQRGCPLDVLTRSFPGASAVRLLQRAGASTWPEAAARALPALIASARPVCEVDLASGRERLVSLGPGEHLLERTTAGGVVYEALDDLGAATALLRLGAGEDAWRRVFPDPGAAGEAVREVQRRAGISFPG